VLVPPERAYDPATLAAVMVALADAPGQVLLASPIMPAFVPAGWHVVTVGDVSALAAPAPADADADADAGKPKRTRRTKAEMAAARAAEAAGATPPAPTLDPTLDPTPDATGGPWFDAGMLIDAPTTIVARTPDQTTYAPTESDDEVAAFFARVRGIAEAK
jgi:hypothetical protein